jgi:hypothetical protein
MMLSAARWWVAKARAAPAARSERDRTGGSRAHELVGREFHFHLASPCRPKPQAAGECRGVRKARL